MLELLNIPQGITAIIGSGGKTTLMLQLAHRLSGRRIISTSTKIYFPKDIPVFSGNDLPAIRDALKANGLICVGTDAPAGKLGAPSCPFEALSQLCDYLLIEADGSHKLPLKAHLSHEPVIPPNTNLTILVAGLSGLGRPICDCAHRPERFAALCRKPLTAPILPEDIAAVISSEGFADAVILNQIDAVDDPEAAKRIASLLPCPVFTGSLAHVQLEKL